MKNKYKGEGTYKYFMMKGKTLAALGALGVLGVAAYSAGAPIGQLAQSMKSQPTAWTVVVGANANAVDVVGASNIIAALETFTVPSTQTVTVTVNVGPQTTSQVPPGAYLFYSSQAPLYLNDNINKVYPVLQVGSGSFQIGGQTYTYQALVRLVGANIMFKDFGSGTNYMPSVGVVSSDGRLLNLTIYFSPSVNVTYLSSNPQQITVLDTSYYLSYNSNNGYMYLVPAANTLTLNVGQSTTVSGLTIRLDNVVKDQNNNWYAVLNINGQQYTIQVGTSQVISGLNVYVVNAFASVLTSGNVNPGYATIVVSQGGYRFPVNGGNVLTSGGAPVSGVTVTTNYNSATQTLSELTFTFSLTQTQPNGDYALLAGQSYQLPIFDGYKLQVGQVQLPTGPLALQLTPGGSNQYTLQYVDAVTGRTVSIPLYVDASGNLRLLTTASPGFVVTITNNQNVVPGASSMTSPQSVQQGGYFAVVDANLQQTYIFQVQSVNSVSGSATLYNYVTGQTITIYHNVPFTVGSITLVPTISSNSVSFSGAGLYYSNRGLTLYEGYNKYVSLDYTTSGTLDVRFVKNYQVTGQSIMVIRMPYNTSGFRSSITIAKPVLAGFDVSGTLSGNVNATINGTANIDVTLSGRASNINIVTTGYQSNVTATISGTNITNGTLSGSISAAPVYTHQPVNLVTIGSNTDAYLDRNGVYVVRTTPQGSNPTIQIYAPSEPLTINVGLVPTGSTLPPSTTQTPTQQQQTITQTVTVQVPSPVALIGKVILDSQVTPTMRNLVLIGGPAVNTLTAQAIIQYVSQRDAALGQQLQAYANNQNGYIYGSQLQPALQQLGIPFGPGTALIMSSALYPNTLVIFGWSGDDTTQATVLFANYLINGVNANVFDNARVVGVNTQQIVGGYPSATRLQ